MITDGPYAEGAEEAGGYVFEAENLDEALALARDILAKHGAVEVWPTVHSFDLSCRLTGDDSAGVAAGNRRAAHTGHTGMGCGAAARHGEFMTAAGNHVIGGAARTVRGDHGAGAQRRSDRHRRTVA